MYIQQQLEYAKMWKLLEFSQVRPVVIPTVNPFPRSMWCLTHSLHSVHCWR